MTQYISTYGSQPPILSETPGSHPTHQDSQILPPIHSRSLLHAICLSLAYCHNQQDMHQSTPHYHSAEVGKLNSFPQEIRDHIYRHVFAEKYLVPFPKRTLPQYQTYRRWSSGGAYDVASIGILETSKATRAEASDIFYAKCKFRVQLTLPLYGQNPTHQIAQSQSISWSRMRHVELNYDMAFYNCRIYSVVFQELLVHHASQRILRIVISNCWPSQLPWDEMPFFKDPRNLAAFKTVEVKLRPCMGFRYFHDVSQIEWAISQHEGLKTLLERTLGNSKQYAHGRPLNIQFQPQVPEIQTISPWIRDLTSLIGWA